MPSSSGQYKPGNCNIGTKELMVRHKFLKLFGFLSLLLTGASAFRPWSIWVWLALVATSFSAIVLWLEIRYHFCIIFGFFSLHNFKELGHLEEVSNPDHQKKDRKRVWEMVFISLVVAIIYSGLIHSIASHL